MLLRNRSRTVTKPALMADQSSQPSPNLNCYRTIPSLFISPKFRDFTTKRLSGTETIRSPTSILDTRALSSFGNPFSPKTPSENRSSWDKLDSKGIGLALVGALKDEKPFDDESSKPSDRNVLFGTQLRMNVPPLPPHRFVDFGTKTKDSQNSGIYTEGSPRAVVTGVLSLSEMELSEDYTCVISHGPNPRTTHIFHNCIVESYRSPPHNPHSDWGNFLKFCYTCKKHLDQTKDIFIYRGEKAFCSCECRHQEMVLDEAENSEFDGNVYS